jgi:hypothetical protein
LKQLSRIGSISGYGKKRIRFCKEGFMYGLKRQTYKSIARIRLSKNENISISVMVNCEVCRSAIALLLRVALCGLRIRCQ